MVQFVFHLENVEITEEIAALNFRFETQNCFKKKKMAVKGKPKC